VSTPTCRDLTAMLPLLKTHPRASSTSPSSGGSLTLNSTPTNPHRSMFGILLRIQVRQQRSHRRLRCRPRNSRQSSQRRLPQLTGTDLTSSGARVPSSRRHTSQCDSRSSVRTDRRARLQRRRPDPVWTKPHEHAHRHPHGGSPRLPIHEYPRPSHGSDRADAPHSSGSSRLSAAFSTRFSSKIDPSDRSRSRPTRRPRFQSQHPTTKAKSYSQSANSHSLARPLPE